jgi:NYN domain
MPLPAPNQTTYLGALKTRGVEVIEGRFQEKPQECTSCGATWTSYEEKESDVSFCVRLLEDAVARKFDVALLITADSDMTPAVRAVRRLRPDAKLVALFPPARYSDDLKRAVHAHFRMGEARVRQAQMPDTIYTPAASYSRPAHWK